MPEEGIRSPAATVIVGGGLSYMGEWELNSRPQQGQATMFLITEASFPPRN